MIEEQKTPPHDASVRQCAKILREFADVAQEKAEKMLKAAQAVGDGNTSKRKAKKLQGVYSLRKNQQNRARFYREAADVLEDYAGAVSEVS